MSTLDDAKNYVAARFGSTYRSWETLTDDDKNRTLVSATDYFNHLTWQGTPTGVIGSDPTTLSWPRSGVFVDGVEIDSTTIPVDIVAGSFELAVLIGTDPKLTNKLDQGSNIQSAQGGGGVGVTFFAPTSTATGTATLLPVIVQRLVGKYLETAASDGAFGAAGKTCSAFSRSRQYSLGWPED